MISDGVYLWACVTESVNLSKKFLRSLILWLGGKYTQHISTAALCVLIFTHTHSTSSNSNSPILMQGILLLVKIATPPPCRVLFFVKGGQNDSFLEETFIFYLGTCYYTVSFLCLFQVGRPNFKSLGRRVNLLRHHKHDMFHTACHSWLFMPQSLT